MNWISVQGAQSTGWKAYVHRDPTVFEPIHSLITVIGGPETSVTTNQHGITFQQTEDRIYRDAEA